MTIPKPPQETQMLTTLAELFDRHKKLQEMRQSESGLELSDRTLSDEQIAAEEYEIVAVLGRNDLKT